MNNTDYGNGTLIRWAIFPEGSSSSFSNSTAMVMSSSDIAVNIMLQNFFIYEIKGN